MLKAKILRNSVLGVLVLAGLLMLSIVVRQVSVEAAAPTPAACFEFTAATNQVTITDYYDNEGNNSANPVCPRDMAIPDTLGGNPVTTIGDYAFSDNHLTSITIPSSVTTIGGSAFSDNHLTSITIPSSVTTIGDWAFYGNHLTSVTVEGNNITSAGIYIFYGNSITSFTYNGTTYTNTDSNSDDCYQFDAGTGTITVFNYADINTIKNHGDACLNKNLDIPSSIGGTAVTTIGDYAFSGNHLTSITIPSSVTTIGGSAFSGNHLTSITIPSSVTTIGGSAFASQWRPGSTILTGQDRIDNVIYAQVYTPNLDPSSIGLSSASVIEHDSCACDYNNNGTRTDIVSAQLINPAYISIVYQDQNGNPITPPSSAPTMITGNTAGVSSTDSTTNLTSYLVKDNPDPTNFANFYKAGDTFNQTITPPAIPGYTTPAAQNTNLTLATGPNEVTFTYTASNNSSSSPTTTINTGNTQLGSSDRPSATDSDSIPIIPAKPTFSGTTYPGATVTVTVHSDPVSCTTTADSNGKWSCTLPSNLTIGIHTVYVEVVHGSTTENLGPYKVRVVAGNPATVSSDDLADTGVDASVVSMVAGGVVVLSLVTLILAQKRHRAYTGR